MADPLDLTPVGVALGAVQTGYGIYESIRSKAKINKLLKKRKAYQTPQEITDILNATEYNAQQGFDSASLDYFSDQNDAAFSSSIAAAERLGSDPNLLSQIFYQNVDGIRRVTADSHRIQMEKFGQYINALGLVADNDAAEQKSQQDLLKDELQAAGAGLAAGAANVSGGVNTLLSTLSANQIGNLYNEDGTPKTSRQRVRRNGSAVTVAEEYNAYNRGFMP